MEVAADTALVAHVAGHGGVLWVRANRHRCCSGALTTLSATTVPPADPAEYEHVDCDLPVSVRYRGGSTRPARLVIELRGRRRPRPAAYWDGCAIAL